MVFYMNADLKEGRRNDVSHTHMPPYSQERKDDSNKVGVISKEQRKDRRKMY